MSDETKKCSIVMMSGDMDKVMGGFIIASTAAAMGMETSIFFTFWGLKAIQKGNPTGEGLMGKMMSLMNRGGIDRIGPSRLNFGGMGRWMFKKMMKQKNAASLSELRQMLIDLDVKLLACQMSMDVMEITAEDLIDEAVAGIGAATYVAEAQESDITLFI
jgi:peroxiredoxin family protein